MNNPLVSVIMAIYNGKQYLAEALQSVFAQDYPAFEVIVVDDGSTDGSADIAQAFTKVHYIHQKNQGVAVARNAAIETSTGELESVTEGQDSSAPDWQ